MNLSELQDKEIINLSDGKKLGHIIDAEIIDNKIVNLIVEEKKFFFNILKKKESSIIEWNKIKNIGKDVILIENKKNV